MKTSYIPPFFIVVYLFQSCAPSVPQQTALMQELDAVQVSANEIRILLTDFSFRFSGLVEETADEIIYGESDRDSRENAQLWKMYAIPVVSSSVFIDDPLAALFDVTVFCVQMRLYFETGSGRNMFGVHQSEVVETSIWLENDIFRLAAKMSKEKDISKFKKEIFDWAENNPLENMFFTRRSTVELFSQFMGDDKSSFGAVVGGATANLDNLSRQVTMLSHNMPKQARWQAEFVVHKMLADSVVKESFYDLTLMRRSLSYIDTIFSGNDERFTNILQSHFAEINRQRLETLLFLENEVETINQLIGEERATVLNAINRERLEIMSDINKAGETIIEENLVSLIDHIFIRLVQSLVLIFIFGMITIFIYRRKKN